MKKIMFILTLCTMLTACGAEESEPAINAENTTYAVSETESHTNPTTQITTKSTVTTVTTAVTTTKITTASAETTVSAEKKKSATTTKKNTEEKIAPEIYEEIDEYNTVEVQYQNNEYQEAEPQKEEITPPPATEPPAEPPESSGISQSEINSYIIQSAANYGMAGASVTSGDIWGGGYSFNSPINTAVNDSVYAIESYADSELSRIYSECLNSGMTPEEIAQYLYVYVCWDGEWLYIM